MLSKKKYIYVVLCNAVRRSNLSETKQKSYREYIKDQHRI